VRQVRQSCWLPDVANARVESLNDRVALFCAWAEAALSVKPVCGTQPRAPEPPLMISA
jgi:hypothetical protein